MGCRGEGGQKQPVSVLILAKGEKTPNAQPVTQGKTAARETASDTLCSRILPADVCDPIWTAGLRQACILFLPAGERQREARIVVGAERS